jgi:hypothetical protein
VLAAGGSACTSFPQAEAKPEAHSRTGLENTGHFDRVRRYLAHRALAMTEVAAALATQ